MNTIKSRVFGCGIFLSVIDSKFAVAEKFYLMKCETGFAVLDFHPIIYILPELTKLSGII
jgi:hypothetical protein